MEEVFSQEDIDSSDSVHIYDDENQPEEWNDYDHSEESNEKHYNEMDDQPEEYYDDTALPNIWAGQPFVPSDVTSKKGRGGARKGAGRKGAAAKEPKAKRGPRSEYFTFTVQLNMDLESSLSEIVIFRRNLDALVADEQVGFFSVGHEIAPETGRHHLQGYLETFSHDVRWTFDHFKALLTKDMVKTDDGKDRIWAKESRGSATQNLTYTGKAIEEGRYYQRSAVDVPFRNYGRGNKLGAVKTLLENGVSMVVVARSHFDDWVKHHRSFELYKQLIALPRTWPTELLWIHGSTGTGKSQWTLQQHPPSDKVYWLDPPKNGNIWWDGYDNHEIVVCDETKPTSHQVSGSKKSTVATVGTRRTPSSAAFVILARLCCGDQKRIIGNPNPNLRQSKLSLHTCAKTRSVAMHLLGLFVWSPLHQSSLCSLRSMWISTHIVHSPTPIVRILLSFHLIPFAILRRKIKTN